MRCHLPRETSCSSPMVTALSSPLTATRTSHLASGNPFAVLQATLLFSKQSMSFCYLNPAEGSLAHVTNPSFPPAKQDPLLVLFFLFFNQQMCLALPGHSPGPYPRGHGEPAWLHGTDNGNSGLPYFIQCQEGTLFSCPALCGVYDTA